MKKNSRLMLWAGSDEAFELYITAEDRAAKLDASVYKVSEEEDEDSLLTIVDGIGVISIHGGLTNKDAWYNRYMGLVSYNEIQEALYRASTRDDVKEILLDISSPGGTVYGLTEAAQAISDVDKIKPVFAFTDSLMASAAMWLGSAARARYAGPLAMVGSIGVVAKHVEYSKMMAEEGITETIIRAGEYKQIVNSAEPLTPKAAKTLQDSVDYAYGVFVQAVADNLKVSYQTVDSKMAQGREFMGAQALDAGLVDAITSFNEVFAGMQVRVSRNNGGSDMKKRYMQSQAAAIAAAASGAPLEAGPTEGTTPEVSEEKEEILAGGTEKSEETPETKPETEETTETKAEGTEEETIDGGTSEEPEMSAVDLLKAQLEEKDEKLFTLKTELNTAKADLEQLDALKNIAATAVNNMVVALGGSAMDLTKASAAELVTQHEDTAKRFSTEYKIGGVSATAGEEEESKPKATISRFEARVLKHTSKPKRQ